MFKQFYIALLCVFLLLTFAACSGSSADVSRDSVDGVIGEMAGNSAADKEDSSVNSSDLSAYVGIWTMADATALETLNALFMITEDGLFGTYSEYESNHFAPYGTIKVQNGALDIYDESGEVQGTLTPQGTRLSMQGTELVRITESIPRSETVAPFLCGAWKHPTEERYLYIGSDASWYETDGSGTHLSEGYIHAVEDENMTGMLMLINDTVMPSFLYGEMNGYLIDAMTEEAMLPVDSMPDGTKSDKNALNSLYEGWWYYSYSSMLCVRINADASWYSITPDDQIFASGTITADRTATITMNADGFGDRNWVYDAEDDCFTDSNDRNCHLYRLTGTAETASEIAQNMIGTWKTTNDGSTISVLNDGTYTITDNFGNQRTTGKVLTSEESYDYDAILMPDGTGYPIFLQVESYALYTRNLGPDDCEYLHQTDNFEIAPFAGLWEVLIEEGGYSFFHTYGSFGAHLLADGSYNMYEDYGLHYVSDPGEYRLYYGDSMKGTRLAPYSGGDTVYDVDGNPVMKRVTNLTAIDLYGNICLEGTWYHPDKQMYFQFTGALDYSGSIGHYIAYNADMTSMIQGDLTFNALTPVYTVTFEDGTVMVMTMQEDGTVTDENGIQLQYAPHISW